MTTTTLYPLSFCFLLPVLHLLFFLFCDSPWWTNAPLSFGLSQLNAYTHTTTHLLRLELAQSASLFPPFHRHSFRFVKGALVRYFKLFWTLRKERRNAVAIFTNYLFLSSSPTLLHLHEFFFTLLRFRLNGFNLSLSCCPFLSHQFCEFSSIILFSVFRLLKKLLFF